MTTSIMDGSVGSHKTAWAILAEAAERVIGKEHSRDDVESGSYDFQFTVTGTIGVAGNPGNREVSAAFAGTLNVEADGVKTPTTPYQQIAGYLLGKMNEATRAVCLQSIAVGDFETDAATKGLFESACKQYREHQQAANPETKRGSVKPVYRVVDAMAAAAAEATPAAAPTTRKQRKAG